MPVEKVLLQMKDDPNLRWLKPLSSFPHKWDQKKYCYFHKDHDHYIEECKDLKEQIEEMIQKGKLQNLAKEITIIKIEEKLKQNDNRNEDEQNNVGTTVSEIRMINGGLVIGGSFKYLWKAHQR